MRNIIDPLATDLIIRKLHEINNLKKKQQQNPPSNKTKQKKIMSINKINCKEDENYLFQK